MEITDSNKPVDNRTPGEKARDTKGPIERKRAARMAAWTRKHGKDDARNPHSRDNS